MAVPIRWLDTGEFCCIALVKRDAVPPATADGGRVDIGRADVKFLQEEFFLPFFYCISYLKSIKISIDKPN